MKNIYKLVAIVFLVGTLVSCEQDPIVYDVDGGQTGLSFSRASQTIGFCSPSGTITVESTTRSSAARTYNMMINTAMTTAEKFVTKRNMN